jgi:tetratricopeptide (TPR) repeat protein
VPTESLTETSKYPRRFFLLGLGIVVVALLVWPGIAGWNYCWAAYQLRSARKALEAYKLQEARDHINQCLSVWPDEIRAHVLALRIARMEQDYDEADKQLKEVQKTSGVSEASNLEWSMLQAHAGDLDAVEQYLWSLVNEQHPDSLLILDALTAGYVRMYRNADATASISYWLNLQPDCIQAVFYRGCLNQRLHAYEKAVADFSKVIEVDPDRDSVRLRLITCFLGTNQLKEALEQAEIVHKKRPNDPDVTVALANCYYNMGQFKEGADLLDPLLAKDPDYAPALIGRGQIALQTEQPDDALKYLKHAVEVSPIDVGANHELYRCYEQLGMLQEAELQHKKLLQVQKNIERLLEISNRDMAKSSNDPALITELGQLMITLAQEDVGEGWLLTALRKDENYGPAHEALAKLYEKKGETDKAAVHRQKAKKALAKTKGDKDKK